MTTIRTFHHHARRLAAGALALLCAARPVAAAEDPLLVWRFHVDELALESSRIASVSPAPGRFLIANVTLVNLPEGTLSKDHAVVVDAGRIAWVGPGSELASPKPARVIDGKGRFLMPGLVDMHVHTLVTSANYLTLLGSGVTTIREMDGFPWLLARRKQADENRLLAPSMFVTGQILNRNDFGGYARAVRTTDEARAAVREQAADGYDAIKIHNSLTIELFDAIVDEARRSGLDVVGHIPQPVPVAHAIPGMRTAEHFKGYIDDATLTLSPADWVTPTVGASIFLTPTFHTYREHLRGADAQRIIDGAEGSLVHPRVLAQWRNSAAQALDDLTRKRQTILTMSREIFETLRPRGVRWLAGTDSGAYDLMVPGPALIDELETMERLGLPAVDVLSAATTNAADAMRWSTRIGRIATGMQADLLILRDNPLETVHNLRSVESVSVRGMWLEDAQALRRAPAEVWSKSATPGEKPDRAAVQAHLDALRALYDRGYAFNHFHLAELKQLITGFGYQDLAADVDLLHYAAK